MALFMWLYYLHSTQTHSASGYDVELFLGVAMIGYFHATNGMWSARIWAKSLAAQKVSVHGAGMEIGLWLFVEVSWRV